MDEDNQYKSHKIKTNTSNLFLGCFGFSRKPGKKSSKMDRKHWFSRSTFLLKQSTGRKTVPVDSDEKIETKKSIKKTKLKKINSDKISLKYQNRTVLDKIPSAIEVSIQDRPKETCFKNAIHETGSRLDLVVDSSTQLSFHGKIESKRNESSQPGSLEATNRTIPRSISLPAASFTHDPPKKSRVVAQKDSRENFIISKRFDPVIGMSIVMVTLIIMVLWGRLCAILCTCAWLYCVSMLRVNVGPHEIEKIGLVVGEPDYSSDEYKKRVVLEGFLKRNHKSVL